jgi:hypothetical protein
MMGLSQLRRGALIAVGLAVVAGTTMSALPAQAATTTLTCGAKVITAYPAPEVGKTDVADATTAGTVTLLQNTTANLQVESVAPASGWKDSVSIGSGTTVRVAFNKTPVGTSQVRFIARVNTAGTRLIITTVTCS